MAGRSNALLPAYHHLVGITVFGGDFAFAAEDLDALIVAKGGLAAVVDGADSSSAEPEKYDSGIKVIFPSKAGINQYRPRREDFFHLIANEEASHIKVVHHHVEEYAA